MKHKLRIIILLLLIPFLCCCQKKETTIDYKSASHHKFGNLSFEMLDCLKEQKIQEKDRMIYSISDEKEEVTVTIIRKRNVTSTLEEFIDGFDEWSPNIENMEEITINKTKWLKEKNDEITWITKYKKNIYGIKITNLKDEENIINNIEEIIEKNAYLK